MRWSDPPEILADSRDAACDAGGIAVRYRIHHSSAYRYGDEILLAYHLLHLKPRPVPNQRVLAFRMNIAPEPTGMTEHTDSFGNPVNYFEIHEPHERLTVHTDMEIEVGAPVRTGEADTPWEALRDRLGAPTGEAARRASVFAYASGKIPLGPDLRDYAMQSFPPGRGIAEGALDLTSRIHEEFIFDPEATTISTPLAEVLAARRGVCQDFAHLQIGCLRSLGLSARYVSGYLRTVPPPGKNRLVGADVSHAWLAVWCGGDDWLDLDPTNGYAGWTGMIALAWGRDYDDISPVRGVILGSREQQLTVEVDVEPMDSGIGGTD